jgi:hypothetical protein
MSYTSKTRPIAAISSSATRDLELAGIGKEGTEWDEEIGEEVYQCWVCRHCVSFRPIRATRANYIKSHLKKEHQIKDDDNGPAFGIRESFALTSGAESSTSIPFDYSISDKTELKRRHCRKTLLNWITHNYISFRQVETEEFQLFASSLNDKFVLYIPTSHGIISDWIHEEFQYQKGDTRK